MCGLRSGWHLVHQRRPPLLEPLDRLGEETDGRDELDELDEGRLTPCDGLLLDRLVAEPLELDEPELVDGAAPVEEPELVDPELPELLYDGPAPVEPVAPDELGRVEP